jgi:hypothetical protein
VAGSGASVGEVYVDVLPNVDRFEADLRTKLSHLPNVAVKVTADITGFRTDLQSKLTALRPVKFSVLPDTSGFRADLVAKVAAMRPVKAAVTPDTSGFRADLVAKLSTMRPVPVSVSPDISGMRAELRARLAAITGLKVKVDADLTTASLATLRTELAGLSAPTITVDVDITGALANIATLQTALAGITAPTVNLDVDNTAALARITATQAALTALTGPTVNVGGSGGSAARAGASDAGAYGAAFRSGIQAALRDLPTPTIGVATGPAEQAVRDLHLSLTRLGAERVGVSITAEQARLEITRLREDITRLRAQGNLSVDVDADIGAAELHLAQLEAQLDAIGRDRTANVRVDDGGSTAKMRLLVTAIAAIGPAAIPAAAAATGALVGIGNAAIASVAGIGVAVLALSGIGGAVKALGAEQQQRAKDQVALVHQDRQLASGADSVRSAIASLANTRATAADGARRSAESIASAERDLGRAQKEALAAQEDITRAREEAKQALEDLDSQVNNNALSIRQANLDLADAKKALDAVSNLPVDARARVEAQLAYDQAKQQLDDLTLRQGRLATEKATADKAGIEGSTQVAAAQQKIAAAQERVQDAERAVADARTAAAEQARQSAFSIAQAQQAVVSAQRSAAAAIQTSTTDAGTSADTLREKLAGLSPAGQAFARFVFGLKDDFAQLRQAAEAGFLPGLQRGIQGLLVYEPQIVAFVSHISDGLGRITQTQLKAFTSEPSRGFFRYLADTAVPTLDNVVTAVGNVARGLGSIVVAFAPVNSQVSSGLVNLTSKFSAWAATLDRNQQFQHFLDYTLTRGPQVEQTIGRILGAGLHFLDAIAPVGDTVLLVIRGIATAINAIPIPILTAAYTAFLAFRIAGLVTPLVMGLANGIRAVATGSATAGAAAGKFTAFLGGPWTIAIAAAVVTIGLLVQRAADTKARVDQLRQAFDNYAGALKDGVNPASLENAKATLAQNAQLRGLVNTLRDAGVSQKILVDGINGDRDARKQILAVLDQQIAQQRALAEAEAAAAGEDNPIVNPAYQKRIKQLEELRKAFTESSAANAEANDLATTGASTSEQAAAAAAKLTAQWRDQGIAARGLNSEQGDLVRTMATLGDATASATQKADAFRHAYDLMFGAVQKQGQATDDYNSKLLSLQESVESNGVSLDNHSRKGLNNRDAMREALRAILDLDVADLANGATLDQVKVKHDQRIADLENEARKLGLSKQATADLVTQYGQIPSDVKTDFTSDGVQVVKDAFRDILADVQYLLKYGYLPPRATGDSNHPSAGQKFVADGGYISGPGGPRDDLIPAMLSDGEFVQQAAATSYYGVGLMSALNQRRIPKEMLPGFAAGGFVQTRTQFPGINPYKRPPVQDGPQLAGTLGFDFATIGTDVIRKQVIDAALKKVGDGGGGGLENIKAFIHRMGAAPYIFGAAGPEAWDCSGAAGAVYGLMLGLPNATSRRFFTTFDFENGAPGHFKPGVGGIYSVGVNPQTHMAGEYGGLRFEAANSRAGIRVGSAARNIRTFEKQFHVELADGGLVDQELLKRLGLTVGGDPSGMTLNGKPVGRFADGGPVPMRTFDTGGWLPPGLTLAYNGLGHSEWVDSTPPEQSGRDGGDTHYHLAAAGPEVLGQLEAMRDREQILSRPGRPR